MKLPAWTYTNLSDFENCPKKYYHKHVAKDLPKDPPTSAMTWGIDVHDSLERRIRDNKPLPATMVQFEPFAQAVLKSPMYNVEIKVAVDSEGKACDFFAPNVAGRGKIDALLWGTDRAVMLDWKTGGVREDPFELDVFCYLGSKSHSFIKHWRGHYVWLKDMKTGKPHELSPARGEDVVNSRLERLALNAKENHFPANPNGLCGWCPVKSCPHNRSK
jgi:hypothetical protein